ncbi:MAG: MFS transporter [Flavobacterium sp.]|nr:MFS transporter [Candidatus Neoflavobacterium equi]
MKNQNIYQGPFLLVCLSSLLFSASFNMLIPELPSYISSLGGAEYKGLVITLFTLTAGISRPFSGKLTDTVGRVPIMAIGSIVCFVCGFLYPILTTVSGFLFLRLLHGFSTGFKPTATAAYVADLIPKERWGEALGFHGLCFTIGLAIGPAIGSAVTAAFNIDVLFYSSSALALLSILILMRMKETLAEKKKFSFSLLKIGKNDIIDKQALPAGIVVLLSYMAYGAILTLIPDWTSHIGIANKGFFFIVFTITSLAIRFIAGKVSDRYGRIKVINAGLLLLVFAMVALGLATSYWSFVFASVLYGISTGILSPALNAWTVDLSHPDHRGKAMATMYIALEIGIGFGAFVAGWFYNDQIQHIPYLMYFTAATAALALGYMLVVVKKGKDNNIMS